ncbi:MAG: hypothetical protein COB15_04940 [Flavobacteriales bacterium]|nr:MAG: hypothetical protein COB15_04940 [Flavobacteriales bacterium]
MKKAILFLSIVCFCFVLKGQETNKKEVFNKVVQLIETAHSTLSDSSFYIVKNSDNNGLRLALQSIVKTAINQTEETFELDLNDVTDVYAIPQASGFTLIVNLKNKVLISKKKIDFENLFHAEVITEDLREVSDLWFLFKKESDANSLEKALMDIKKAK